MAACAHEPRKRRPSGPHGLHPAPRRSITKSPWPPSPREDLSRKSRSADLAVFREARFKINELKRTVFKLFSLKSRFLDQRDVVLAAISSSQELKNSRNQEVGNCARKSMRQGNNSKAPTPRRKDTINRTTAGWSPLLEFLTSRLLEFLAA